MRDVKRKACFDETLRIEAYRFRGIAQPFPNHFHEYYVLGLIEGGERVLSCKNAEYTLKKDDIVIFNPGDNHGCVQVGKDNFDYRCINISIETMRSILTDIGGESDLPLFSFNVIRDEEAVCYFRALHQMIMVGCDEFENELANDFEKEESLLLLMSLLLRRYSQNYAEKTPECRADIENTCAFIRRHYAEHISLQQICDRTKLSKSSLLRAFSKEKGVTPYRYLTTVRINEAKRLLERGVPLVEAAMMTGFSDQSHFTNYFRRFIGLAPGAYREIFIKERDKGEAQIRTE